MVGGEVLGVAAHTCGELGELVECGILTDQRELALDDAKVQSPDVFEDAADPAGRVVPALARRARPVRAAANDHEHGGLAREGLARAGRETGVGEGEVDPGLQMLGDSEVVEGGGNEDRLGVEQFIDDGRGEGDSFALLGRTLGLGGVAREDGVGPRGRRQRVKADVATGDGRVGLGLAPGVLDDVANGASRRKRDMVTPRVYGLLLLLYMLLVKKKLLLPGEHQLM
jgi:hypothetical protein